ncbi:MAG: riboflavin biosynthesis protein RibF [Chloroflexota bacterium]|nr:riboflavin biosynthesis protein RibF [Chloroflexota bacterium]
MAAVDGALADAGGRMRVVEGIDQLPSGLRYVATVGVFDGVHRGHCAVLRTTVRAARAEAAAAVVVTLDPHPEAVLRGRPPLLLSDPAERLARLAATGIDFAVVQHFDLAFASLPAERFVERLARGRELEGVVMSSESAFGNQRRGTPALLAEAGRRIGFNLLEVSPLRVANRPVSSSTIRELVGAGQLSAARRLLGRAHAVVGEVVHGEGRGRALGYPTANLAFREPVVLPPDGIYAVRVSWGGENVLAPARRAEGVASLGVRPTFGPGQRVLEVHLFGVDEPLYGERLRVAFVRRQRSERRFADAASLIRQMRRDADRARQILDAARSVGASEHVC